jgi:hypothetical protein
MSSRKEKVPALGRLRSEDLELEASLGYILRPSLIKTKTKMKKILDDFELLKAR